MYLPFAKERSIENMAADLKEFVARYEDYTVEKDTQMISDMNALLSNYKSVEGSRQLIMTVAEYIRLKAREKEMMERTYKRIEEEFFSDLADGTWTKIGTEQGATIEEYEERFAFPGEHFQPQQMVGYAVRQLKKNLIT